MAEELKKLMLKCKEMYEALPEQEQNEVDQWLDLQ